MNIDESTVQLIISTLQEIKASTDGIAQALGVTDPAPDSPLARLPVRAAALRKRIRISRATEHRWHQLGLLERPEIKVCGQNFYSPEQVARLLAKMRSGEFCEAGVEITITKTKPNARKSAQNGGDENNYSSRGHRAG